MEQVNGVEKEPRRNHNEIWLEALVKVGMPLFIAVIAFIGLMENMHREAERMPTYLSKDILLTEDVVYHKEIFVTGGNIDLNGHTLTAEKDFTQFSGTINLHGGRLIIKGNYDNMDWFNQDKPGHATLVMNKDADYMSVGSEFRVHRPSEHVDLKLSAGSIEVGGAVSFSGGTPLPKDRIVIKNQTVLEP